MHCPCAKGGTGHIGDKAFFVYRIEARYSTMFLDLWPRIDRIPGCPGLVATAVKRAIPAVRHKTAAGRDSRRPLQS